MVKKSNIRALSMTLLFSMLLNFNISNCGLLSLFLGKKPPKVSLLNKSFAKLSSYSGYAAVFLLGFVAYNIFSKLSKRSSSGSSSPGADPFFLPPGHEEVMINEKVDSDRVNTLLNWAKEAKVSRTDWNLLIPRKVTEKVLMRRIEFDINGQANLVCQLRCSQQEEATCGLCSLNAGSILQQYFSQTDQDISTEGLNNLINGSIQNRVRELCNLNWLNLDQLRDLVAAKQIPGLNNENVTFVQALPIYFKDISNPEYVLSKEEQNLLDMDIRNEKDGFSHSFVLADFDSLHPVNENGSVKMGHWICFHVEKHNDQFYWFVVCSLNRDRLNEEYMWVERLKFLIHKLLGADTKNLYYHQYILDKLKKETKEKMSGFQNRLWDIFDTSKTKTEYVSGQVTMFIRDLFDVRDKFEKLGLKRKKKEAETKIARMLEINSQISASVEENNLNN